eukprot:g25255.t1
MEEGGKEKSRTSKREKKPSQLLLNVEDSQCEEKEVKKPSKPLTKIRKKLYPKKKTSSPTKSPLRKKAQSDRKDHKSSSSIRLTPARPGIALHDTGNINDLLIDEKDTHPPNPLNGQSSDIGTPVKT